MRGGVKRLIAASLAALAGISAGAAQKKPARKPDIEILKIASVRQEGSIVYEGAYLVSGEKPIVGLVIHLAFYESRGGLLSQQSIQLEPEMLAPGERRDFDVQGRDVPRAVRFLVSATDRKGRDLLLAGGGPYPLD